jgi:hypothetical protein
MLRKLQSHSQCILAAILWAVASAGYAAEPRIVHEDIEWCDMWIPAANDSKLPRVFLVGDSVCRAYYDKVAEELQGKANVAKLATSSSLGDPALLDQVKLFLNNYDFAVIHFNNGLHGFDYTDEEYRNGIPRLLEIIRRHAPSAKLIWATSTPIRKKSPNLQEFHKENEIVKARNKIVVNVVAKEHIPMNDLYGLVKNHPEYWEDDGIHFKPEGQAIQAKRVARSILDALGK